MEPLAGQARHCPLALEPVSDGGRIKWRADRRAEHEAVVPPCLTRHQSFGELPLPMLA
jgi:hypothetical protein